MGDPAACFGLGWFLITAAPYLDWLAISPRGMGLADRYLYGPSAGFLLLLVLLLDRASQHVSRRRAVNPMKVLGISTGVLVLMYVGLSAWYMPVWRDNLSLSSRMVRDAPLEPVPHLNLGTANLEQGNLDLGIAELQTAARLRPEWVRPQIPLALALVAAHRPAEGFRVFNRIAPAAEAEYSYYVMRGRAHLLVAEPEAAAEVSTAGLRRFPTSLPLRLLVARAREAQGDAAGAIQAYGRVLTLDPRLALAHEGLGKALAQQGDFEAAAQSLTRALELAPDRISALRLLALAREAEGRTDESLRLWGEVAARTQDPGYRAEALKRIRNPPPASRVPRP